MASSSQLHDFVENNKLSAEYIEHAQHWFDPVVQIISAHQKSANSPFMLGINGCQGSGKSTLASYLAMQLQTQHQLNVAVLSLDDFYYNSAKRKRLAMNIHPLLATRGVPGTHNLTLALETIKKAKHSDGKLALPRFDKKRDEPAPKSEWPVSQGKIDVIILEGWCLGLEAQTESDLIEPINDLEAQADPKGIWRTYVNEQLKSHYQQLHQEVDFWLMLKAPSFSVVKQWRLEQEQKLLERHRHEAQSEAESKIMNEQQITHFISFFQRLTEHALQTLPSHCHFVYHLDAQRSISKLDKPRCFSKSKQALIFTDLDGTLLDHDTYSHQAAQALLEQLARQNIPLIANTSKTAAELKEICKEITHLNSYIVENGAAAYLAKSYFPQRPEGCSDAGEHWLMRFSKQRSQWQHCLNSALTSLPEAVKQAFVPMYQMSTNEICQATGLSPEQAQLAASREHGEPLLWKGPEQLKAPLIQALNKLGAKVLEGGRFLHVCGDCDKGQAMQWFKQVIKQTQGIDSYSIALGDGNNDIAMLEAADIAVVIKSPAHAFPKVNNRHTVHSRAYGPEGWAAELSQILEFNTNL